MTNDRFHVFFPPLCASERLRGFEKWVFVGESSASFGKLRNTPVSFRSRGKKNYQSRIKNSEATKRPTRENLIKSLNLHNRAPFSIGYQTLVLKLQCSSPPPAKNTLQITWAALAKSAEKLESFETWGSRHVTGSEARSLADGVVKRQSCWCDTWLTGVCHVWGGD